MENTKIYGFSKRGRGHKGKKNQDYIIYKDLGEMIIAVVCDGVSSSKYSDVGAQKTAKITEKFLKENFEIFYLNYQIQKENLLKEIHYEIEKIAEKHKINLHEFSSTLGFVAIKDNKYICGQLGDGIIGIYPKNSDGKKFLPSKESDLMNSKTYTIFNNSKYFEICTGTYDDIDGFLLATDGLNNIIYYENSKYLARESKYLMSNKKFYIKKALFKYSRKTMDDISFIAITKKNRIYKTISMTDKWYCPCGHHNLFEEIVCPYCKRKYTNLYGENELFHIEDKNVFFYTLEQYMVGNVSKLEMVKYKNENEFYKFIDNLCIIKKHSIKQHKNHNYYSINIDGKQEYLISDDDSVFHKIEFCCIPLEKSKNIIDIGEVLKQKKIR